MRNIFFKCGGAMLQQPAVFQNQKKKNDCDEERLKGDLITAAAMGEAALFEKLLNHPRINLAESGSFLTYVAASNGQLSIIKLLLDDKRVNPAGMNDLAIRWAIQNDHYSVVEELLRDTRICEPGHNDAVRVAIQYERLGILYCIMARRPAAAKFVKQQGDIFRRVLESNRRRRWSLGICLEKITGVSSDLAGAIADFLPGYHAHTIVKDAYITAALARARAAKKSQHVSNSP